MNSNILERILAGEDPEVIGKEFADELNKAVAEKKQKDEEAKKIQKRENELTNLARIVAVSLYNYMAVADPELAKEIKDEVNGTEMREILDGVIEGVRAYKDLGDFFDRVTEGKEDLISPVKKKTKVKVSTADDEIAEFLKHFGLK